MAAKNWLILLALTFLVILSTSVSAHTCHDRRDTGCNYREGPGFRDGYREGYRDGFVDGLLEGLDGSSEGDIPPRFFEEYNIPETDEEEVVEEEELDPRWFYEYNLSDEE